MTMHTIVANWPAPYALRRGNLAATAQYPAQCYGEPVPEGSPDHGRGRPFFAGGLESLKARLTKESPAAFRRRMLFASKNALDRSAAAQVVAPGR